MTQPPPPAVIGNQPPDATTLSRLVGGHLQTFLDVLAFVRQDQNFLAATDLQANPYYFSAAQETDLKTAISGLDTALQGIDLTFINRVVGLHT